MSLDLILSTLAGILTTVAFLPQAIKTIRSRRTEDISLGMYITFTTGVFFWFLFGVMIGNWPIIVANIVTFALAATILVMKIRHG